MPAKRPPTPPPCPQCGNETPKFRREYDNYFDRFSGIDKPPISTSYIFACPCGCSFSVTIPKEDNAKPEHAYAH